MSLQLCIEGRRTLLEPGLFIVGRPPEAHWDLDVRTAAARHAQFDLRDDGSLWLAPVEPRPGTFVRVNGAVVVEPLCLHPGDDIELGPFPAWCRRGAQRDFVIKVEVEGLTEDGWRPIDERWPDSGKPEADLRIIDQAGPKVLMEAEVTAVEGDLRIEGCAKIRRISFPRLTSIGGRLILDGLPDLEEVAFPSLIRARGILVRGARWLTHLEWPRLQRVDGDIVCINNGVLIHIDLPMLQRIDRLCCRFNPALSEAALEALQAEFARRCVDGHIDAASNGETTFEDIVRRRLAVLTSPDADFLGNFERFVRVAPELLEVHEQMLRNADIDGDRFAAVEHMRRMLVLAQAQNDDRETEYDQALQHLLEPPSTQQDNEWTERAEGLASAGPLRGVAAGLWAAELSANCERPAASAADGLLTEWRYRGAQFMLAPFLSASGHYSAAARCLTRPSNSDLAYQLWNQVPSTLRPAVISFGRLVAATSVLEAASAFVQLAEDVDTQPSPVWSALVNSTRIETVGARARAAAAWITEDMG
ncbi:MAG: FHA domain-containing protein [Myxococcota bacterium]